VSNNNSWQKVRFDEICKNVSDRIDDPKQADTDYYVGLEHLDSEDPKISRHGSPQDVGATKLKFKTGQILFGKRRWYLRKLAVAKRDGICSAHMMVLESINDKIKKEFLSILMQGDNFYEKALSVSAGSLSPTIKWKDLASLQFFLPPIAQQENILSITHKIDHTISNSQNLLEKTKNYMISRRESLLTRGIGHTKFKKVSWLFGKEIEIPEEWEKTTVGKHTSILIGNSFPSKEYSKNPKDMRLLRGDNITEGTSRWKEKTRYWSNYSEFKKYQLLENDFVISMDGSKVGKNYTYIKKLDLPCLLVQRVACLRSKSTLIQKYLGYIFGDKNFINYVNSVRTHSAIPHISTKDIQNFSLLLPTLLEQHQIVSILSNIDEQITQQQSHLTNLKVLRKSILNSRLTMEKTNVTN
jgi:type I restriction enzyme, S subunit